MMHYDVDPDSLFRSTDKAILSRWASWQPERTVRTEDHQSRENELKELAGVHIVRKLGPLFAQEAVPAPRPLPVLGRTNSEILRRWREIEEESGRCERRGIGTYMCLGGGIEDDGGGLSVNREADVSPDGERLTRMARRWGDVLDGRSEGERERAETESRKSASEGHVSRYVPRLRGREARLEQIKRAAKEREKELVDLKERRRVSGFAHRGRLQSLLRRRYFHHGVPLWEKTFSTAANELRQLRDQHPVTGLREGFIFSLENNLLHQVHGNMGVSYEGTANSYFLRNVGSVVNQMPEARTTDFECNAGTQNNIREQPIDQDRHGQEEYAASSRMDWEQDAYDFDALNAEVEDANRQQNVEAGFPQETLGSTIEDDENQIEIQDSFLQESDMVLEHQQDDYDISGSGQSDFLNRIDTSSLDHHNVNMELRQLLNRRCVTNMSSEFHDSLDRLVRSFILRQERDHIDWNLQQNLHNPDSLDNNHGQQRDDVILAPAFSVDDVMSADSVPPTPPPQPIWHQHDYGNLSQLNMHQPHIEQEVVNDLKADISKLQEGMTQIQRMLDACLNMQEELQRSLRQEVSAALNRYIGGKGSETDFSEDGSKWIRTRKGTCCICCDNPIDSLLYRCGHMCTCYQCGSELFRTEGKCPLCRAPLVEVIRAYSVL